MELTILRFLVIAVIVYLIMRQIGRAWRNFVGASRQAPPREIAVETVKCPGCGTYFAAGTQTGCGQAGCPATVGGKAN